MRKFLNLRLNSYLKLDMAFNVTTRIFLIEV